MADGSRNSSYGFSVSFSSVLMASSNSVMATVVASTAARYCADDRLPSGCPEGSGSSADSCDVARLVAAVTFNSKRGSVEVAFGGAAQVLQRTLRGEVAYGIGFGYFYDLLALTCHGVFRRASGIRRRIVVFTGGWTARS